MTSLHRFLTGLWRARRAVALALWCFALLVGFADSAYLVIQEQAHRGYRCDVAGFDCNAVLRSSYATLLGIPWAIWGFAYYAGMLTGTVAYVTSRRRAVLHLAGLGLAAGVAVSGWLAFVQWRILGEWCLYCVISESVVALAALSYAFLVSQEKIPNA